MALDVSQHYPIGEAAADAARAALSDTAFAMSGSQILGIATQVREMITAGEPVCNLTVGDFAPEQFGIPESLRDAIGDRLAAGDTNYPPSDGLPSLRQAICDFYEREVGIRYPVDAIVVGSGARPPLYAAFRCLLDPGDTYLHGLPTWNNQYYVHLNGVRAVRVRTGPETDFFITPEHVRPHLRGLRLIHLNTPLNPCGTAISEENLRGICELVVEENRRRQVEGGKALHLLFDMVYWLLTYGDTQHHHPVKLVPEIAPYLVQVDALSKAFAGTGLRVGWGVVPPHIHGKMKALTGHMGAWAARPVQSASAWFLNQPGLVNGYLLPFKSALQARLDAIYEAFAAMKADGLPVDAVAPQGAIYLSIRLDLMGRRLPDGTEISTNEQIRNYLLQEAKVAVVPFQAFGLEEESGWFRTSVGAVGLEELQGAMGRVRAAVERIA